MGIQPGDRVAVYSAMNVDSCVTVLGTTAIGGVYCSAAIEMNAGGILDRFEQVSLTGSSFLRSR